LTSRELFKGVVPFLVMEAVILALLVAFPSIATQLPAWMD
jgi:TRAP-type mannitol/chloroaromatic compound transport system permease large subunit